MIPGRLADGPAYSFQGVTVGWWSFLWWLAGFGIFRRRIRRRIYARVVARLLREDGSMPEEPVYVQIGAAPRARVTASDGRYEELP